MRRRSSLPVLDVLVVAEKDTVARAFARYLATGPVKVARVHGVKLYLFRRGSEFWGSIGLRGHLLDYDFSEELNVWERVDPRTLFFATPRPVVREESYRYYLALRDLAHQVRKVYLALDADPEGECIAFEVMEVMRRENPSITFQRLLFSAVTRKDILRALANPTQPNKLLADKARARMIADLTVGAAFTRLLTLAIRRRYPHLLPQGKFLSYGPCQSPVLFLVVKRALEREQFQRRKYWQVQVKVEYSGQVLRLLHVREQIWDQNEARRIAEKIRLAGTGTVVESRSRLEYQRPPIPLNTVELEKRASSYLNIRAKECMDIAERLYQEGLISYPRTETTIYPPTLDLREVLEMLRQHPQYRTYAENLLQQPVLRPTRGSEDDRAHPPIYPTGLATPEELRKIFGKRWVKAWKLYDLVVRHFLATLSPPAVLEKKFVKVVIGGEVLTTSGLEIVEPGYLEVYPFERPSIVRIPPLPEGTQVKVLEVKVLEKQTEPPPYLSEAELLKLMREYGIGTDATMQDHIHTNVERGYFVIRNRRCIPTPLGKVLAVTLYKLVPDIVRPEVRGSMERELSKVATGEKSMWEVVREIRTRFLKYFDILRQHEEELARALAEALREVQVVRSRR